MVRRELSLCQHAVRVCMICSWEIVCYVSVFFFPLWGGELISRVKMEAFRVWACESAFPSRSAPSALYHQDTQNKIIKPTILGYCFFFVFFLTSSWNGWVAGHQRQSSDELNAGNPSDDDRLYPDLHPHVPSVVVFFPPRTASLIYACPDVSQSRQRHHLVLGVIWGSLTELEVRTAERNMTCRRFYDADSFPIVLVLGRLWVLQVAQHFSQGGFMKMWNQTN